METCTNIQNLHFVEKGTALLSSPCKVCPDASRPYKSKWHDYSLRHTAWTDWFVDFVELCSFSLFWYQRCVRTCVIYEALSGCWVVFSGGTGGSLKAAELALIQWPRAVPLWRARYPSEQFQLNCLRTVSLAACCTFPGGLGIAALAASSDTMFSNWVVDAVQEAYLKVGWLTPAGMPAHYLWSISSVISV